MSAPALRTRSLQKRFGRVHALRGIDLEQAAGSSLAILGPNGAGKSTLLRILAGLTQPTSGDVDVAGESRSRQGLAAQRAKVGYVGHSTLLYGDLTAHENLVFVGRLYGVEDPARRATQLLAEEGLEAAADRQAGGFSRGMAQRLSIARALVHDPPVVLLDEPFTGLDLPSRHRLTARLQRLRDEGRSLVLVTHEPRGVPELADAAVVLSEGRVVHRVEAESMDADALERIAMDPTHA